MFSLPDARAERIVPSRFQQNVKRRMSLENQMRRAEQVSCLGTARSKRDRPVAILLFVGLYHREFRMFLVRGVNRRVRVGEPPTILVCGQLGEIRGRAREVSIPRRHPSPISLKVQDDTPPDQRLEIWARGCMRQVAGDQFRDQSKQHSASPYHRRTWRCTGSGAVPEDAWRSGFSLLPGQRCANLGHPATPASCAPRRVPDPVSQVLTLQEQATKNSM